MTDERWARFLEHAARAFTKPTFDDEERDWKLDVAARLGPALDDARAGREWLRGLRAAFRAGNANSLTVPAHRAWLAAWAAHDVEGLRAALGGFCDRDLDPAARFARFADASERVAGELDEKTVAKAGSAAVLALGSLFNFAVEPDALPLMRAAIFDRAEELVGQARSSAGSLSLRYEEHLAFAREAARRMAGAGIPVRDMVDVQSLIFVCVAEQVIWASDPPPDWDERAHRELEAGTVYLAVCAVYRDEAHYLREWVEFHRLMGVERFFLYDNLSTDEHRAALAPYVAGGTVVLHEWPASPPDQREVYERCLAEHRDDARWIAFIDVDEFLFSPEGRPLTDVLREYEAWPAVGANLTAYGTSGHERRPDGLAIESYVMRDTTRSGMMKTVVDPLRTVRCETAHSFAYEHGLAVDENKWPIAGEATKLRSMQRLRVNHYAARSIEEAREKQERSASWSHLARWRDRAIAGTLDEQHDDVLLRWAPAVRDALARTAGAETGNHGDGTRAPGRTRST